LPPGVTTDPHARTRSDWKVDGDEALLAAGRRAHSAARAGRPRIVGRPKCSTASHRGALGRHALLVAAGLAKTMMSVGGDALALNFSRIQFTPDLMPSDITGTE